MIGFLFPDFTTTTGSDRCRVRTALICFFVVVKGCVVSVDVFLLTRRAMMAGVKEGVKEDDESL